MKKIILFFVFILALTFFSFPVGNGNCLKLLKFDESFTGKNKLNFSVEHVESIVKSFSEQNVSGDIEFIDLVGNTLAKLGTLQEGKIKWDFKVVNGKYLQVKLDKNSYRTILEKIEKKEVNPGYQIRLQDIGSCDITFSEKPDLAVQMKYPIKASPNQSLAGEVSITVENRGTAEAKEVEVQLVISTDMEIPIQPATFAKEFQEDVLLEGGKSNIASIKPGEQIVIKFDGSLKVPADTNPGRYYLGCVIDPGKKINELSEENNKEAGFIMVSIPMPKRLMVKLADSQLVYKPSGFSLNILCQGVVISDGQDWRKCAVRPYIHQIMNATWGDYFWEVDTVDRSLWKIKGIKFCKKGGTASELKTKINIKGGSKTTPPISFTLDLPNTQLEYEPAEGKFKFSAFNEQIIHASLWRVFKVKSHIIQVKHVKWADFFWEIDTFRKELRQVSSGIFGQSESSSSSENVKILDAELVMEY